MKGLKGACSRREKFDWTVCQNLVHLKKIEAYGASEALHPSILSRYVET
jgi:hypothetical protein